MPPSICGKNCGNSNRRETANVHNSRRRCEVGRFASELARLDSRRQDRSTATSATRPATDETLDLSRHSGHPQCARPVRFKTWPATENGGCLADCWPTRAAFVLARDRAGFRHSPRHCETRRANRLKIAPLIPNHRVGRVNALILRCLLSVPRPGVVIPVAVVANFAIPRLRCDLARNLIDCAHRSL